MATDRAPMMAASRAVPFKTGLWTCCRAHAPYDTRRGLLQRNRSAERAAWRAELSVYREGDRLLCTDIESVPSAWACGCRCHDECIAEQEPFCLGCDNSYADMCSGDVPSQRGRLTYG